MGNIANLIFTNGCFDLIHVGHIRLLEYASSLGPLVVGLNSDDSVRRLKGPSRPVNSEEKRKEVLLAIKFVSEVYVFNDDTPIHLIKELRPRIVVKGGDYRAEDVVGYGMTEVRIFPFVSDISSTSLITRIAKG